MTDAAGQAGKVKRARTCVACQTTSTKGDLVRFVRTPSGDVELDPTGRKPGRGAYLCAKPECFAAARKRNKLAPALKAPVTGDTYDRLEQEFIRLCETRKAAQE